jgi:hypothetical protein
MSAFDRLSIEPSRVCSKRCSFCYNGSSPRGVTGFSGREVVELGRDCAANGVRFISIGGGEPLEWPGLFEALGGLRGSLSRSLTTNGLPLASTALLDALVKAAPDKIHLSIHAPTNAHEVERVAAQALELDARGLVVGINLLVRRDELEAARAAVVRLTQAGLDTRRVVFLPARGTGLTPTPLDVAYVATGQRASSAPFQSMSCLSSCSASERFVSVGADRTVAWCSYTVSRRPLEALSHRAVVEALEGLELTPCTTALVRDLPPRPHEDRLV